MNINWEGRPEGTTHAHASNAQSYKVVGGKVFYFNPEKQQWLPSKVNKDRLIPKPTNKTKGKSKMGQTTPEVKVVRFESTEDFVKYLKESDIPEEVKEQLFATFADSEEEETEEYCVEDELKAIEARKHEILAEAHKLRVAILKGEVEAEAASNQATEMLKEAQQLVERADALKAGVNPDHVGALMRVNELFDAICEHFGDEIESMHPIQKAMFPSVAKAAIAALIELGLVK